MAMQSMDLEQLKAVFMRYHPGAEKIWPRVEEAYRFALTAHSGQLRESGQSYITHPLGVARILADLELDAITITAALLHDVVEDTAVDLETVQREFGSEVTLLVDGVTKLSRIDFTSKEEQQAESLRKMFIAMAKDIRVILIKLADRLHNLRTLCFLHAIKQKEIAQETLEIYAPLAHRLGVYKIKSELEDLAFRYMSSADYYSLAEKLAKKRREREDFINHIIAKLEQRLAEVGIYGEIQGRPKNLYSIFNKMKSQDKTLAEIYDLTAVRVIVDNVKDCYGTLGIVHTLWRPIPGRFKDFIAMPKPNMYQSLHTTVVVAKNELAEIQIRTWEMHRTAEYGIAAHWRYKEGAKDDREMDEKLAWLRQLLEWQHDYRDAREYMESLKIDLFPDEVFVFTPRGDVVNLPAGAIPLDFAFRIHTDVGNRCTGARVNGRLVTLDYKLRTGDMVEIITAKQGSPSRDWLKIVRTPQAKNKIRSWFKKERREENIEKGKEMLERELRRQNLDHRQYLKEELLTEVGGRFNFVSAADVYAAVGYGGVTSQQVTGRLQEEYRKRYGEKEPPPLPEIKPAPKLLQAARGVRIQGITNLLVHIARCCTPVPGDEIVGFVTRGRGVSVHRSDCPNLAHQAGTEDRFVEATWEEDSELSYPVVMEVTAMDRPSLLADVTSAISEGKVNITAVRGRTGRDRSAVIQITMVVRDRSHLEYIMNRVKKVKDIYTVRRFIPTGHE